MSLGFPNTNLVITDEDFASNQEKADQVEAWLQNFKRVNDLGHKNFDQIRQDLTAKIQEGEEARFVFTFGTGFFH